MAKNGMPTHESDRLNNRSMFVKVFDHWANLGRIYRGEAFLLEHYLRPEGRTLEEGCGGGRLLLALQERGFTDLHGFDYMPEFVEAARRRDSSGKIEYRVADAACPDYPDASFDQILLMQQLLCFLPSAEARRNAVAAAYRMLRPGGNVVVCVHSDRSRRMARVHRVATKYFAVLRVVTFRRRSLQWLPWLRTADKKWNFKSLLDLGPYVYWFREAEAVALFTDAGFEIVGVGSDAQLSEGRLRDSVDELQDAPFFGGLYLVCRKPALA